MGPGLGHDNRIHEWSETDHIYPDEYTSFNLKDGDQGGCQCCYAAWDIIAIRRQSSRLAVSFKTVRLFALFRDVQSSQFRCHRSPDSSIYSSAT